MHEVDFELKSIAPVVMLNDAPFNSAFSGLSLLHNTTGYKGVFSCHLKRDDCLKSAIGIISWGCELKGKLYKHFHLHDSTQFISNGWIIVQKKED